MSSDTVTPAQLDQLVYVSRRVNLVNSRAGMADILVRAAPNNSRDGITGCLTVVDGQFVQILEGDPGALDLLMERIMGDTRHADVRVLKRERVVERAFPAWSMLSPLLAKGEIEQLRRLLLVETCLLADSVEPFAAAVQRQDRAALDFQRINERSSKGAPCPGTPQRISRTLYQAPIFSASAWEMGFPARAWSTSAR